MCFAFYWFCCTYFQQRSWIWTAFSGAIKLNGGDTWESEGRAEDLVARASWFVGNQHQDSGVVVLLLAQGVVCFCFVFCSDPCVWGLVLYHCLEISLLLFWLQAPVPCSWLGFSCCKALIRWRCRRVGRGWIFVSKMVYTLSINMAPWVATQGPNLKAMVIIYQWVNLKNKHFGIWLRNNCNFYRNYCISIHMFWRFGAETTLFSC